MNDQALTEHIIDWLGLSQEQAAALRPAESLVVVSAGAGTGKTTTMAARFALSLMRSALRGATPAEAVNEHAAVTFTELAAGELRSRIGRSLRTTEKALAEAGERELAAFAAKASEQLVQAAIGTIHGLCARLLRRPDLAAMAGVSPDFVVMDALDAGLLWQRAVEEALDTMALKEAPRLERILAVKDGASRLHGTIRGLAERLDMGSLDILAERGLRAFERQALEAGAELLHRLCRPDGPEPSIAAAVHNAERRSVALRKVAGPGFTVALDVLRRWCSGTGSAPLATEPVGAVGATEKRLSALDLHDAEALEAFSEALGRFKRVADRVVKGLATDALEAEHRWTTDLIHLARLAKARYAALKEEEGALDFADLETTCVLGLRRHRTHAREQGATWAKPFRFVLVDELQDTSRQQAELFQALLGDDLSGLFAVGDPKQSIYRFRFADVSVFQDLFVRAGNHALSLTINRRSSPQVLAFVNALFDELFPAEADPRRPYLAPAQSLTAARSATVADERNDWPPLIVAPVDLAPAPTSTVTEVPRTLSAAERRGRDAQATSEAVGQMVQDGLGVAVLLRAVRGGNRAYLDALDGLDVVAELAASGTFTLQAATALGIALARAFGVLGNDAAWVAVLRSPVVGLSDHDVARVAMQAKRQREPVVNAARELLDAEPLLLGEAGHRLQRVLQAAVAGEPLHRRIAYVLGFSGVRSRQLDKLVAMVASLEAQGRGPAEVVEVLDELVVADRSKRVPDPTPVDGEATGPGRIQALTVHASKGLEFETVMVPQLVTAADSSTFVTPDAVWANSGWRVGLALPKGAPSVLRDANRLMELEREEAEQARLLYVALTRARDRIVLNLPTLDEGGDASMGTDVGDTRTIAAIRKVLAAGRAAAGEDDGRPTLQFSDTRVGMRQLGVMDPEPSQRTERSEQALRGLNANPVPRSNIALGGPSAWSVTALANLAYCPAYFAQHRLAPTELQLARGEDDDPGRRLSGSGQERGIAVHELLSTVRTEADLDGVGRMLAETEASSSRMRREWPTLRRQLELMMRDSSVARMFRPEGLWREFELAASVDGVAISGALDRLSLSAASVGRLSAEIGEFKTGRRGWGGPGGRESAFGEAYRFQLATYVVMLAGWLGPRLMEPVTSHLMYVDLGVVETKAWTVHEATSRVRQVLREIHAPMSLPLRRTACPECPIRATCAAIQ